MRLPNARISASRPRSSSTVRPVGCRIKPGPDRRRLVEPLEDGDAVPGPLQVERRRQARRPCPGDRYVQKSARHCAPSRCGDHRAALPPNQARHADAHGNPAGMHSTVPSDGPSSPLSGRRRCAILPSDPGRIAMLALKAKPEPLEIALDQTAMVVVDMQNAFASKGGMFDLAGVRHLGCRTGDRREPAPSCGQPAGGAEGDLPADDVQTRPQRRRRYFLAELPQGAGYRPDAAALRAARPIADRRRLGLADRRCVETRARRPSRAQVTLQRLLRDRSGSVLAGEKCPQSAVYRHRYQCLRGKHRTGRILSRILARSSSRTR